MAVESSQQGRCWSADLLPLRHEGGEGRGEGAPLSFSLWTVCRCDDATIRSPHRALRNAERTKSGNKADPPLSRPSAVLFLSNATRPRAIARPWGYDKFINGCCTFVTPWDLSLIQALPRRTAAGGCDKFVNSQWTQPPKKPGNPPWHRQCLKRRNKHQKPHPLWQKILKQLQRVPTGPASNGRCPWAERTTIESKARP